MIGNGGGAGDPPLPTRHKLSRLTRLDGKEDGGLLKMLDWVGVGWRNTNNNREDREM